MKQKILSYKSLIRSDLKLIFMAKLTFMFFMAKGIFWIGLSSWLIFKGMG